MAVMTGHDDGLFDNQVEFDLVAAPQSGTRTVTMLKVYNADTASATPKLRIKNSERVGFDDEYLYLWPDDALASGERMSEEGVAVAVLGPTQSLVGWLAADVTTSQPEWTVAWVDEP